LESYLTVNYIAENNRIVNYLEIIPVKTKSLICFEIIKRYILVLYVINKVEEKSMKEFFSFEKATINSKKPG